MKKLSFLTLTAILLSSTALASDTGQSDDNNWPGDVNKALHAVRSAGAHVEERLHTFVAAAKGDPAAHDDLPVSVRQVSESSSEAAGHAANGARNVVGAVSGALNHAATAVANEAKGWHHDMTAQHRSFSPEAIDEDTQSDTKAPSSRPASPVTSTVNSVENSESHGGKGTTTLIDGEYSAHGDALTSTMAASDVTASHGMVTGHPTTPVTTVHHTSGTPEGVESSDQVVPTAGGSMEPAVSGGASMTTTGGETGTTGSHETETAVQSNPAATTTTNAETSGTTTAESSEKRVD